MKLLSTFIFAVFFFGGFASHAQMKSYAWSPHPSLTPMVWLRCDEDLRRQINAVAGKLKAQPPGSRALFLWHDWPDTWNVKAGWGNMVADGPFNLKVNRAFLDTAFALLAAVDVVPDRIVIDNESAPCVWWIHSEPEKALIPLFENPRALAKDAHARRLFRRLISRGNRRARAPPTSPSTSGEWTRTLPFCSRPSPPPNRLSTRMFPCWDSLNCPRVCSIQTAGR